MSTVMKVLVHGTSVWSDAVSALHQKVEMEKIQWKVTRRCARAYRIVSTEIVSQARDHTHYALEVERLTCRICEGCYAPT